MRSYSLYLLISFTSSFLFSAIFTVSALYQVISARLDPLQLVLVGTALELTVFLGEIPTGLLADLLGRKRSIAIGYAIMGIGFVIEGAAPLFWNILLAQIVWGMGYTFTSGAIEAWISDELDESDMTGVFLRGKQAENLGGVMGVPLGVLGGLLYLYVPILAGGALMVLFALFLGIAMQERRYSPASKVLNGFLAPLKHLAIDAGKAVKAKKAIVVILLLGFLYGFYSEGFDRLWTPHLLEDFNVPVNLFSSGNGVVTFGLIRVVALVAGIGVAELFRRPRVRSSSSPMSLFVISIFQFAALMLFSLTASLFLAIFCFWLVGAFRNTAYALYNGWLDRNIEDSRFRALRADPSRVCACGGYLLGTLY